MTTNPSRREDPERDRADRPEKDDAPARHRPDPDAGLDREVGDLDDPDAEDDGALPGRVGGGLAGG